MPITQMSYSTADNIISIYSNLLINADQLGRYEKYSYSYLEGYDLIDISNALKLTAAYRVFIHTDIDERQLERFRKHAAEDSHGLMLFFFNFYPDNVVVELNKLNSDDKMAIIESIKLTTGSQSEMQALFNKEEAPESFLDYCLHIRKSAPEYWEKIYNRVGITWETKDRFDHINFSIEGSTGNITTKNTNAVETKSSLEIIWFEKSENNWIRWILFFPCAVFGCGFILNILQNMFPFSEYASWVINYVRSPLIYFFCSLAFITIGVLIAPSFKLRIALILLIIVVLAISNDFFTSIGHYFRIVRVITGLLGGIIAYYLMDKRYK